MEVSSETAAGSTSPADKLFDRIKAHFNDQALTVAIEHDHVVVQLLTPQGASPQTLPLFTELKQNPAFAFDLLVDITAVDWMDSRPQRFEVVYHLLSIEHNHRLRIKVPVEENSPSVPSLTSLWAGANFVEREVWDMYGIKFEGHPDLRRVLLYDEFKGHPLRKDYPVQLKQPRVPLRHPEVENTARRMQRPDLVSITSRKTH